ncbi:GerAB/ArcD/ProY family transporter [Bacillus sp. FSL L8-0199]|uniref:GerAB/ArcD/ProY family transporter n=1 Tax=Bacillus TaxID=1386 RepID=UPI000B6BA874|nr:GerAB/ArcD/ProY family transporter [Bacillus thuringiensis]OUB21900.1 spore gernimation protein GerH [Bacillus thuringiensis serovar pirenaica]
MMKVKMSHMISPFFVFFVIHGEQFGAGVLGFSRIIAKEAGYDAWIGVLFTGIVIHCLIWIMYYMLSLIDGSILDIHTYVLGPFLGKLFNIGFMLYFLMMSVSTLRTYVEIVQVWLFPTASTLILSIILSILIYYIISSGFRVITGICVISIFASISYMILCLYCLIRFGHFENFLPMFNHNISEILLAAKGSGYTMAGFEIILMIYPFIKSPKKSFKFAQYSVLFSNFLYLLSVISALAFFSEGQLSKMIWSQLSMTQVIQFSFLERIEYIVVCGYALIMISSIILPLWAHTRGMRGIFHIKQKYILRISLIVTVIISMLLKDRQTIDNFITQISNLSLYLIFIYIPTLCLILHIKVKMVGN